MSYDEDDGFGGGGGFKMYDDSDDDEFADPADPIIDDYDLEDENPEKDG